MIGHEQQLEPCVALELNADGVSLTVSARLRQGAANWTPAEAGDWFARNWQEAQQALWVCMVHRAVAEPGSQLVRSGETPWVVAPQSAAPELPVAPEPAEAVPAPAAPARALPVAPSKAASTGKRKTAAKVTAPSSNSGISEADEARAAVLSVLTRNDDSVSVADLKLLTEMSDYRVRKALRELQETGTLIEERREAGAGRWKETVLYRLKGE